MNYEKNYYDYIKYVKSLGKRELEYFEVHHILPRCLGGSDEPDNLVVLTAREHFLAHYLLTKIYPENFKLIDAFRMMGVINKDEQKRYINSRLYESKKKLFALARGMKVRCVETGEEFNSITEAERKYCYGVRDVIKGRQLTAGGYHWERIDGKTIIKQPFQRKKVICANTGEIFDNFELAADFVGVSSSLIKALCNNNGRKGTAKGYTFYYYEGEEKEYPILKFEPKTRKVRCIETGEEFDSIKEAAKGDIQLAKRISQGCREGGSVFGFHWEYTENKERISSKKKKVRCVETGKIYKSISEAANWKYLLRSKIAACCCGEIEEVSGFHGEYVDEEAA